MRFVTVAALWAAFSAPALLDAVTHRDMRSMRRQRTVRAALRAATRTEGASR